VRECVSHRQDARLQTAGCSEPPNAARLGERKGITVKAIVAASLKACGFLLQKSVPYLLLEILLPGGTLFALLLLLYERRHKFSFAKPSRLHVVAAHRTATPRKEFIRVMHSNGKAASVWRGREARSQGIEIFAMAHAA